MDLCDNAKLGYDPVARATRELCLDEDINDRERLVRWDHRVRGHTSCLRSDMEKIGRSSSLAVFHLVEVSAHVEGAKGRFMMLVFDFLTSHQLSC